MVIEVACKTANCNACHVDYEYAGLCACCLAKWMDSQAAPPEYDPAAPDVCESFEEYENGDPASPKGTRFTFRRKGLEVANAHFPNDDNGDVMDVIETAVKRLGFKIKRSTNGDGDYGFWGG